MHNNRLNIIIPMAGAGSRFQKEGYDLPKPFIDIKGKMMIERVLEGVKYQDANYIIIIQKSFLSQFKSHLDSISKKYNVRLLTVEKLTQGASCTVLSAYSFIGNNNPMLICDCDNIIDNQIFRQFVEFSLNHTADGALITFHSNDECFSFARLDQNNDVCEIKEKEAISNYAIAGFYFVKKGDDFVKSAINTIIYGQKSKNEFYISGVYQDLIDNSKTIKIYNVDKSSVKCVGTPKQLASMLPQIIEEIPSSY